MKYEQKIKKIRANCTLRWPRQVCAVAVEVAEKQVARIEHRCVEMPRRRTIRCWIVADKGTYKTPVTALVGKWWHRRARAQILNAVASRKNPSSKFRETKTGWVWRRPLNNRHKSCAFSKLWQLKGLLKRLCCCLGYWPLSVYDN